ncbi:MAG: hypothetical protein PVF58_07400 [Candidatus Methanofastidiosia archaeon]
MTKEWAPCKDWGYIGFVSHPRFLTELMHKLEKIPEITEKELYQLRSTLERPHILINRLNSNILTMKPRPWNILISRMKKELRNFSINSIIFE